MWRLISTNGSLEAGRLVESTSYSGSWTFDASFNSQHLLVVRGVGANRTQELVERTGDPC